MTDITIPPEALEAARNAYFKSTRLSWQGAVEDACLAMLQNWPGMKLEHLSNWVMSGPDLPYVEEVASIILPLPTENTNAKG